MASLHRWAPWVCRIMGSFGSNDTLAIMSEASAAIDMPLVSIVVPNFNHRQFLPERLDSIFAQTYRNIEICFLDDASTDDSVRYVQRLVTPFRLNIDVNRSNSGNAFRQWARGLSLIRGEFVWIAEADDSCSSTFLEQLLALANRNPTAGLVYSQSRIIDEQSRVLEDTPRYLLEIDRSHWRQDYFARGVAEVSNYLILRNTVPNASACLFRRDALRQIELAEMPLRLCGDWLTYAQILSRHDIAFLAAPLNFHRRHAKTLRTSSDRGEQRICESYFVQQFIRDHFTIAPDIHELACRFTFREWRHLQRTAGLPSDFRLSSAETFQAARMFDTAIDRRFEEPGAHALPSLQVRQRSWRTAWRWRSEWQAYRDDHSVTLRSGPCRGEVRLDPLSRAGSAKVERLLFFRAGSPETVADFSGALLAGCLGPWNGDSGWHVDEGGARMWRGERRAFWRIIPPKGLERGSYEFEIVLRADPPTSLSSPKQNDGVEK